MSLLMSWGAGMVIFLGRDADLHMAQLTPLPLTSPAPGFTFLVPAHLGSHGQKAVKWVLLLLYHAGVVVGASDS